MTGDLVSVIIWGLVVLVEARSLYRLVRSSRESCPRDWLVRTRTGNAVAITFFTAIATCGLVDGDRLAGCLVTTAVILIVTETFIINRRLDRHDADRQRLESPPW